MHGRRVFHSDQLACIGTMSKGERIRTNDPHRREPDTDCQGTIMAVGKKDELFHIVAWSNHQRVTIHLGKYPNSAAFTEAASRVQGRFLCRKEGLEPGEGVTILEDVIPGAYNTEDTLVCLASDATVGDLSLRVTRDQRDQFNVPIQPRLDASSLPIVQIGRFRSGVSQAMPKE